MRAAKYSKQVCEVLCSLDSEWKTILVNVIYGNQQLKTVHGTGLTKNIIIAQPATYRNLFVTI